MSKLEPIKGKLAKLIPMLSSDNAGEVFAAAQAIKRSLQSVGCDFHDLAQNIGGGALHINIKGGWEPPRPPQHPNCNTHAKELKREWVISRQGNCYFEEEGFICTVFVTVGMAWKICIAKGKHRWYYKYPILTREQAQITAEAIFPLRKEAMMGM